MFISDLMVRFVDKIMFIGDLTVRFVDKYGIQLLWSILYYA